jgi:tetratricopeptide (TPR) repeat protein
LPEIVQSWLLNSVALRLHATGRLNEALEPMRVSGEVDVVAGRWAGAAASYGNLAELELTLGKIDDAIGDAVRAMDYAERSESPHDQISERGKLAYAEHQAGRADKARGLFEEAETMQAKMSPSRPWLYSLRGYFYSDLLLAVSERRAWRHVLGLTGASSDSPEIADDACRTVTKRTTQTLSWVTAQNWLVDIALDDYTLSRAALYVSGSKSASDLSAAGMHATAAVNGLRNAAIQYFLPLGLLTRAWLRALSGVHIGPDSAQEDLDEAWEIAERGPMRLFMADIHLYRARLFHAIKPYPWSSDPDGRPRGPKDDLAAARKLIEQCGYWRRKEELEDAEEAAKGW